MLTSQEQMKWLLHRGLLPHVFNHQPPSSSTSEDLLILQAPGQERVLSLLPSRLLSCSASQNIRLCCDKTLGGDEDPLGTVALPRWTCGLELVNETHVGSRAGALRSGPFLPAGSWDLQQERSLWRPEVPSLKSGEVG